MKKRTIFGFLVLITMFVLHNASADFACGKVISYGPDPSWEKVKVYYDTNQNNYTYCEVSPSEFKYCCDPTLIREVGWGINKKLYAEIFNPSRNSYTEKVSLYISGQGYDIFPDMELKNIILIEGISNEMLYTNNTSVLNISTINPFDNILLYMYNGTNYTLMDDCHDCNNMTYDMGILEQGNYALKVKAYDLVMRETNIDFNFSIYDDITINRSFVCSGCSQNYVFANGSPVEIALQVNSKLDFNGVLYDYFPVDWEVTDRQGGTIEPFSETHNIIYWRVDSNSSIKKYIVIPPKSNRPKLYFLRSRFNDYYSDWEEVYLYRLLKSSLFSKEYPYNAVDSFATKKADYIGSERPLVVHPENSLLNEFAIFSNSEKRNVKIRYGETKKINESEIARFGIFTDILNEDIKEIFVKFGVNKKNVENISNSRLYNVYNPHIENELNFTYDEDGEKYYIKFLSKNEGEFILKNVK